MRKSFAGAIAAFAIITGLGVAPVQAAGETFKFLDCDGTYTGITVTHNVRVSEGATCVLIDSTVQGGVFTAVGAVGLFIHDTTVGLDVVARGVTGTVHIGPEDCGYDPVVGRNVIVLDSHNVLICETTVGNNINVQRNDGRITVRDSVAPNNVLVKNNLPVTGGADAKIRVLRNGYGNTIQVSNNAGRPQRVEGNYQLP